MPYVSNESRTRLLPKIQQIDIRTDGELNYVMTMLAMNYFRDRLRTDCGDSYEARARVVSGFECAKLEFVDAIMRPYEDKKRAENGDVYGDY